MVSVSFILASAFLIQAIFASDYGGGSGDDTLNGSDFNDNFMYGSRGFEEFSETYGSIHKPLVLIIPLFGVLANTINIIVLTRRDMITPTNILLTGLSVAQLLLLLSYLSLVLYNFLREQCLILDLLSYNWAMFKNVNIITNVVFHTTALLHTLLLAIFCFVAVKIPHLERSMINIHNARKCVIILHSVGPVLCVPTFFTTLVSKEHFQCCQRYECYDVIYRQSQEMFQFNLWFYGVVFKLVPSITIGVLSFYLISSLKTIDTKTERLMDKDNSKRKMQRQRLTKMLVTVVLLCVTVELPHGILNLLTGIFGIRFGREVYDHLGDFFEMLILLYSSVNFILYCFMSKEFKNTIKKFFTTNVACFGKIFCPGRSENGSNCGVEFSDTRETTYSEVPTQL